MNRSWPPRLDRGARRVVIVSVALAVLAHVGFFTWLAFTRQEAATRPSAVEGFGTSFDTVSGVPMKRVRNLRAFRVINQENGAPVWRARVSDVLGGGQALTAQDGMALLAVRPAAQLIVQVEKPGFAPFGKRVANARREPPTETLVITPAPVPYAIVDTIFIQRCNYCHGAAGHTRGVDLTMYKRVMTSRAPGSGDRMIVVPFQPDSSLLVRTLRDLYDASGKPTDHATRAQRIDEMELEWIVRWIEQGALNKR